MRYRGLAKNTAQLHTLRALTNLWLVRRELMGALAWVRPNFAKPAMSAPKSGRSAGETT